MEYMSVVQGNRYERKPADIGFDLLSNLGMRAPAEKRKKILVAMNRLVEVKRERVVCAENRTGRIRNIGYPTALMAAAGAFIYLTHFPVAAVAASSVALGAMGGGTGLVWVIHRANEHTDLTREEVQKLVAEADVKFEHLNSFANGKADVGRKMREDSVFLQTGQWPE